MKIKGPKVVQEVQKKAETKKPGESDFLVDKYNEMKEGKPSARQKKEYIVEQ